MSVDRLPGLGLPLVFLVAVLAVPVMLWRERRRPSSYTRSREFLAGVRRWRGLSAVEQAAFDSAVLDAAEAAERRARPRPLFFRRSREWVREELETTAARLDAIRAAESVVREADAQLDAFYELPVPPGDSPVVRLAEVIVEAEHARAVTEER